MSRPPIYPLPEAVRRKRYEVIEGRGHCDNKRGIMAVPLDGSPASRRVIAHETAHARWSPRILKRPKSIPENAVQRAEDLRMNLLTVRAGAGDALVPPLADNEPSSVEVFYAGFCGNRLSAYTAALALINTGDYERFMQVALSLNPAYAIEAHEVALGAWAAMDAIESPEWDDTLKLAAKVTELARERDRAEREDPPEERPEEDPGESPEEESPEDEDGEEVTFEPPPPDEDGEDGEGSGAGGPKPEESDEAESAGGGIPEDEDEEAEDEAESSGSSGGADDAAESEDDDAAGAGDTRDGEESAPSDGGSGGGSAEGGDKAEGDEDGESADGESADGESDREESDEPEAAEPDTGDTAEYDDEVDPLDLDDIELDGDEATERMSTHDGFMEAARAIPEKGIDDVEAAVLEMIARCRGFHSDGVAPGSMEIVSPPRVKRLSARVIGKMRSASTEGTAPRWMNRYCTDGAIFGGRAKRPGTGTVLFDTSGSMSLSVDDVQALMEKLPAGTIAAYSGWGNAGQLRILAKGGRRVADSDINVPGACNVVDVPALEWLAQQAEPRLWVCDGVVTGKGDHFSRGVLNACARICREARILRLPSMPDLERWLEKAKKVDKRRGGR